MQPTLSELDLIVESISASAPSLSLAILLAAYGGLRLSEWRGLRRKDLIPTDGRFIVSVTRQVQRVNGEGWVVGAPKSAEGVRDVKLPLVLTPVIEQHLSNHVDAASESLLFKPSGTTEYLDNSEFNQHWDQARRAAGIDVHTIRGRSYAEVREHDLRHFHLSHYAESGATLAELKQRAGHATMQAAIAYQHAVNDRSNELAGAMPTLAAVARRFED